MEFLQYLSRIDFAGAVLLGVAVVVIALAVHQFLQVGAEDLLHNLLPGAGRWLGLSALDAAHQDPGEAWFCQTCKSLNLAGATICYRGCGPRPDLAAAADAAENGRPG